MRTDRRLAMLAAAWLLAAAGIPARADLVVRAGRAFDGERFVNGPTALVVRGGRLASEGAAPDAPVLDAPSLVVMPGLIDLRSGAGSPPDGGNEESSETTPTWRALDAVDPQAAGFARALDAGVTTIVVAPGPRAVVGGLAGAVKTDTRPLAERVVAPEVALVFTLGNQPAWGNRMSRFQEPWGLHFRRPGNRMGVVSEIRRGITAAREGAGDPTAAMLRRVMAGDLPAWFVARTETDARTALRLAEDMGARPTLLEPFEGHRLAADLASRARGAVIGPEYQLPRRSAEWAEGRDMRPTTASILHDAGLPVALATGLSDDPGGLRDRAALAVRHGLSPEAALAAVTSVPASLLGLSGRIGTLRPGADADLVLLDGDPLSPATRVVGVLVEGRLVRRDPACPEPLVAPETSR